MSLFGTRGKAGWVLFVMHLNSDSLFLLTILPEKYTASLFYFHLNTVTKYVLIGVVGGKATYIYYPEFTPMTSVLGCSLTLCKHI